MAVPVKCQRCGAMVQSLEEWRGYCAKNLNEEGKSIGHGLSKTDGIQFMNPNMARFIKNSMETPAPEHCVWCMSKGNGMIPGVSIGRFGDANGRILDAAFCDKYGHRERMKAIERIPGYCMSMETLKTWLDADCEPEPEVHFKSRDS